MIRINLIPYRVAHRQQQIMHHVSVFVGILVLAGLIALAAHSVSSLQLSDLKEQTIALQNQNAELKKKIGKIENLANLRSDVERKLAIVDRLQEGRFHSLKTLNELAKVIPENIWLDSIKDAGKNIELTGLGESNKAVASFMRRLDQSPLFTDIRLGEISRVQTGGLPVRRFTLRVTRVDEIKLAPEPESKKPRRRKVS